MQKAMYGTRRASQLYREFMVGVFDKCGYETLAISRQMFFSPRFDSLAALHGDDVIVEGEQEALDFLDQAIKPLCNVKVLPRVGPGATVMGRYLKRYICYIPGVGYEWNDDPKHVIQLLEATGKTLAKPQGSPSSKDIGKSDPQVLDEQKWG